jgi:hypothetical protein
MQLVFTRSEIYRPEILRRDLSVSGHGKSCNDEWAIANVEAAFVPRLSQP